MVNIMDHKAVGMMALRGERIVQVTHGTPKGMFERLSHYNPYTIITESGKTFVIWNTYGETYMTEVTS